MTIARKRNVPGYIDEMGRFRPIRSPQYIGSGASKRKATVRDKKKYSKAKAGDLGKARQERALEAPWDREYRLEQEAAAADAKERARIEKEIEADVYGETSGRMSSGKAQSLAQFVRGQGGINTAARARRGRKVYGDLENFTRKGSGTSGLVTTVKGKGKGLDTMWQLARQSGFDLVSSDDLLDRLDDEIRSGKMTYATHGSLSYNPIEMILWGHRKGDPDWAEQVITTKAEHHAAAKKWAKENGFDRFRVARLDLSTPPDFKGTVRKNPYGIIQAGQVVTARSIGDSNIIYSARVLERKGNFVKILIDGDKEPRRVKVRVSYDGEEYLRPDNYSMAPQYTTKPKQKYNPAGRLVAANAADLAKARKLGRESVGLSGQKYWDNWNAFRDLRFTKTFSIAALNKLHDAFDQAAGKTSRAKLGIKRNPTVTAAERAGLVKFFKTLGMDGMAADVKAGGDVVKALKQSVGHWKSQPKLQAKMRQLIAMLERKSNPAAKKNPVDLIGTFANLAVGISSAMHIDEAMKRRSRKPAARKRGTTKAKTTARRSNPSRMSTVKAKGGDLYVLTIQRGDDEVGIFLHDGNANGFSKEVKTLAAARAYAKRTGRKLVENPKANRTGRWFKVGRVWFLDTKNGIARVSPNAAGGQGVYRVHVQGRHSTWTANVHKLANAKKEGAHWLGTMVNPAGAAIGKKAAARSKVNPAGKLPKGCTVAKDGREWVVRYPDLYGHNIIGLGKTRTAAIDDARGILSRTKRGVVKFRKSRERLANPRPSAKTPRAARKNPRPTEFKKGDRVRDIYTGKENTVSRSYWQNYAGGSTADYTVEFAGGGWNKSSNLKKIAKRKNPPARVPVRRTFEMFQGRPATTAKRLPVSRHAPARLDQLGDLIEVKLNSGKVLDFSKRNFKLCTAGGKLWIAGGKIAKLNPAAAANEINPIDSIDHVVYGTSKPHHGDHNYTHYIHKLGEESGHMPTLCADREGFPIIRGGKYKIEARGIVN